MRLAAWLALLAAPSLLGAPARVVESVRLDVGESAQAEYARYVAVEPGRPLDAEAVRRSVTWLYATGHFRDVVVTLQELPGGGLAVVFAPEPIPRLSDVGVEGDRVISSGEARESAALVWGEPLPAQRLERASRDVALELAARGYLEGRVSARVDGAPDAARVVFAIEAGPRARVGVIELTGVPGAPRWKEDLAPGAGEPFELTRAERSAERLREAQRELGYWRARVELGHAYDPATSSVALRFDVVRGPRLRVEFEGDPAPGGLRRRVAEGALEGGLEGDALDEALERLEEHFRQRGHRDARVSYREEARTGETVGVFEVEAGARSEVAGVSLRGDVPPELALPADAVQPGDPVDERRIDALADALADALLSLGYARGRVETELAETGGQIPLVYRITPGPRMLVRTVRIESSIPPPEERQPRELRLREGRPYRLRDLAHARATLLSTYRNAGYLRAEVLPDVELSEDGTAADVTLRVTPGPRTRVGRIVVAGLDRTRESTVRRELTLREGEPLGFADLLESQRRLGSLGVFSRVEIVELNPEATDRRDLLVRVTEAPSVTVAYGLGYSEREKVRASLEVTRYNLRGAGRSVTAFARGSAKGSRFLLTYREPYLFGRRQELLATGFREEDDRDNFDYVRYGGLLQTAVRLSPPEQELRTSLILRYVFQETETFNVEVPCDEVDRQYCSATTSGPSAAILNDTRDDPLDPRRGHFLSADVQWSAEALGGNSYLKAFFQGAFYHRASSRLLVALGARAGLARTFGLGEPLRLPLPERFFAGGAYSIRGFEEDQVEPEGGNALLLGNLEVRLDVTDSFGLAAFSDVGNVYPLVSEIDLGHLRYTAGLGLRYDTAVGPVRIDWGYKLNRRPGESASELHVTIGHAF